MIDKEVSEYLGNTVAQMLIKARKSKKWTLYRLQRESGIDASNIFRIENGQVCPRIDTLNALCEALDVQITFPLPV